MKAKVCIGLVIILIGCFTITLHGQQTTETIQRFQEQIDRLQQQVAQLQARVAQLEAGGSGTHAAATASHSSSATAQTRPGGDDADLSQRVKNVEEENAALSDRLKKLGPVTFNGEFRLYFDSLTRPASQGAPRVSNIRGRYLLHLDFKAPIHRALSVQGRLSTAPLSNPLTDIQDFGAGVAKHPFFLSEAFVDFHPNPYVTLQGGRLDSPFNDRSRFLFDLDTRFNGTNEIFRLPLKNKPWGITRIQWMAGQYTFTNPNFPIILPGTPSTGANATPSQALLAAGALVGTQPRASQLFQQGMTIDQTIAGALTQQLVTDVQLYRNPNQLRLLSTPAGSFLIGTTLGLAPFGVFPSPGNATTTPNGATLTAASFHIAHLSYTLRHSGIEFVGRTLPFFFNVQWARNVGPIRSDRDALAAIVSAGRSNEAGDVRLLYAFYLKQANSLISEVTENDIALGSNVNMAAHLIRAEVALAHGVVFANNFIFSSFLRDSNPADRFFVPFGRAVPTQFRYQGILQFRF